MTFIRTLTICLLVFLVLPQYGHAQKILLPLSPILKAKEPSYFFDSTHRFNYILQVKEEDLSQQLPVSWKLLFRRGGIFMVSATPAEFIHQLSGVKGLLFVDEHKLPATEAGVINYDMSLNRINAVWRKFPELAGLGSVVSIKEDMMDTSDIDLSGRSVLSAVASSRGSTHATAMTTIIAGAGNSFYTGKGVVPKTGYSSSDFINALPDTPAYYTQPVINVQNHSYGIGIQNYYGINANAFDLSENLNHTLQHVFSAGNSGTATSTIGPYAGIQSFANITGNMKMAKNVLVIGAVDSSGKTSPLSSRGPAFDGRIKPELVAYGDDGSSGAAAIASGTCILVQQAFNKFRQITAPAWLLRSVLINSASDIGAPGPDFESGYGLINALTSVETVMDNRYFAGEAVAGSDQVFSIDVPAGSRHLKITLSWNDTAAQSGANKALVNDIDLELFHENSGTSWQPWTLNIFPSADSLRKIAVRGIDTLNNNEQISVEDPLPGSYQVRIKGKRVLFGPLPFAVSYRWDTADSFQWDAPMQDDPVIAGSSMVIRWTSTFPPGERGSLQWRFASGSPWISISDTVLLSDQHYKIMVPDTISPAAFRMVIGTGIFESEEFLVSPSLTINYGFACDTSLLVYWKKVNAATQYHLFHFEGDQMTGKNYTADTVLITTKTGSPYYSVAPVLGGMEGFRGPSVNYQLQAIGCYINSFLADLVNDHQARLQVAIGSTFQVKQVFIRKLSRQNEVIFSTNDPLTITYTAMDTILEQGINQYQASVILEDGTIIYSSVETVYFLNQQSNIIFPNPVHRGEPFYLLSDFPVEGDVVIYDTWGRKMKRFSITEKQQQIPIDRLPEGVYYLIVYQQGRIIKRLPFIVQ